VTKDQSRSLVTQVAREYLGEAWNKKLTSIQCEIWEEVIVQWDYASAKDAIKNLFINHPACRNEFNFKMPDVDILSKYYKESHIPQLKDCLECDNTRWVVVINEGVESVRRCECINSFKTKGAKHEER
jgi:hypothetical protein